jgi:hypothetical protein
VTTDDFAACLLFPRLLLLLPWMSSAYFLLLACSLPSTTHAFIFSPISMASVYTNLQMQAVEQTLCEEKGDEKVETKIFFLPFQRKLNGGHLFHFYLN